jgi:hypothetical protein
MLKTTNAYTMEMGMVIVDKIKDREIMDKIKEI